MADSGVPRGTEDNNMADSGVPCGTEDKKRDKGCAAKDAVKCKGCNAWLHKAPRAK